MHKNKVIVGLSVLVWLLASVSCKETPSGSEAAFESLSFDEDLASITLLNDSISVVGSEHGDLFYLVNGQRLGHQRSLESRIYQLYADGDSLWAGVRSSGVVRMETAAVEGQSAQSDVWRVGRRMSIPLQDFRYSPYGLICYRGDTLLVATSHGLYYFSTHQSSDQLLPIAYKRDVGRPFVFCSPVASDGSIYVASDDGVVRIDRTSAAPAISRTLLQGHQIRRLEFNQVLHRLYALSDDSLFVVSTPDDRVLERLSMPFTAFSMVEALGKFYFLNQDWLYVSQDLTDLSHATAIRLPHPVPTDTRNNFVYDRQQQELHIVTRHAVLSLSAVNGIGQSANMVLQSAFDEAAHTAYFLTPKNDLFAIGSSDTIAQKLLRLPSTENVSQLTAYQGTITYVANRKQIRTIRPRGPFRNIIYNQPSTVATTQKDITALHSYGDLMLVGVRDSLMAFRKGTALPLTPPHYEPYVTHITSVSADTLYATTLNNGLWCLVDRGDSLSASIVPATNNIRFQADLLPLGGDVSVLLNHHYLYLIHGDSVQPVDSVALSGYRRLLMLSRSAFGCRIAALSFRNLRLFDVTSEGFRPLPHQVSYGQDFIIRGCLEADNRLYLSTEWGTLAADSLGRNLAVSPTFLSFDRTTYDFTFTLASILLLLALFVITYLGIKLYSYRQQRLCVEALKEQLPQIKATAWKERVYVGADAESVLSQTSSLRRIRKCLKRNEEWLAGVASTESKLQRCDDFCTQAVSIPGVTQGMADELAAVRNAYAAERQATADKRFQALHLRMETLASSAQREAIAAYVGDLLKRLPEQSATKALRNTLEEQLQRLGQLAETDAETVQKMLIDLNTACQQSQMQIALDEIHALTDQLTTLTSQQKLAQKACSAADETEVSHRRQLFATYEQIDEDVRDHRRAIREHIRNFYATAYSCHADEELFNALQIHPKASEPSRRASLLVMLAACSTEKSTNIYSALGGDSYTYRSDLSRLLADIRAQQPQLKSLSEADSLSIARFLCTIS